MKQLTAVVCLLIATSLAAQVYRPASQTITTSGTTAVMPNLYGGFNATFEEIPSGAPATVSITVQGCMTAGTCDTAADTNTTTSATIRGVAFTKVYSYFIVTASWTGGSSPTVTVNSVISTARSSTGGGAGTGTVTSVGLTLPAVFTVSGSPVTTTGSLTAAFASIGAHLYLGNNTAGSATAALVRPACADLSDFGTGCSATLAAVATSGSASDLAAGTLPAARLPVATTSTFGGVKDLAAVTNNFITSIVGGVPVQARPTCGNLSDSGTGCSATLAAVATSGSATDLGSGTLNNARLPSAPTFSGTVTAGGFVGTGNYIYWTESTDPGLCIPGTSGTYASSALHGLNLCNNGNTVGQVPAVSAGVTSGNIATYSSTTNGPVMGDGGFAPAVIVKNNAVNTGTSSMTLDMHLSPVTSGWRLPQGAAPAPTTQGVCAFDTTTNTLRCGDGTNTKRGQSAPYASGCGNVGVNLSTTSYAKILGGVNCANNTEGTVRLMLPLAGTVTNLCVTTTGSQSGTGSLVVTFRDSTSAANSALTTTFTASQGATANQCDNTNTATITAGHDYVVQFLNNATAASAAIAGISLVYNY